MTREQVLALHAPGIIQLAKQLRVGYQLKRTMRYASKRDQTVHTESVAEHKFALMYLKYFFLPFEDPERTLNESAIDLMLIFHDFGEIPDGIRHGMDVPYHLKTATHEEQEARDAHLVFEILPLHMGEVARRGWNAYQERATPEAKFAYALDKIEPQFELFEPLHEQTFKRLKQTYESHVNKKLGATAQFPVMRRFVEVLSADMLKRDVFWKPPQAAE